MSRKLLAFTLIELLVVIAIIGIISGLIVVTMNGVTAKANIAKAQVFSNSLRNALMLNLVSEWKLDGSGNDSWSGGNNGTWYGSAGGTNTSANYRPSSECISGQCLTFDGTDDYVGGVMSGLSSTKRWVFSVWAKTSDTDGYVFDTRTADANGASIYISSSSSALLRVYSSSVQKQYSYTVSLSDNQWHYIVATRDSDNSISLYVDASLKTSVSKTVDNDITNFSETWSNFIFATNNAHSGYFLVGFLDEARIFNAGVPVSQIKEQYYAGLNNLLINGNISEEEYLSRINQTAYGK
ncbi:MAG: LamG domain-containing protein [Candidatus Pacebacteria bacterium]|nr:LamG domain-containing protein [Candidatus Paceibacterota bacterium]